MSILRQSKIRSNDEPSAGGLALRILTVEKLHICDNQGEVKSLPNSRSQAPTDEAVRVISVFVSALNRQNPYHLLRLYEERHCDLDAKKGALRCGFVLDPGSCW